MRWILTILLLSSTLCYGADSLTTQLATKIYQRLNMDTSGTELFPRVTAVGYAKDGLMRAGYDFGIEETKVCTLSANVRYLTIDTGLIEIASVTFHDSTDADFEFRFLKRVSHDSITKLNFIKEADDDRNATSYSRWGDAVMFGPVSSDDDIFTVRYWKQTNDIDSETVTNLPAEYLEGAILYGLYLSSDLLQNGRAGEYWNAYWAFYDKVRAIRNRESLSGEENR